MPSIEDSLLERDRRGIRRLRDRLPSDYCTRTAKFALGQPGLVFVVTGFYILQAMAPETDGPPGALALGDALTTLGYGVRYVTDDFSAALMRELCGDGDQVITFPVAEEAESERVAHRLLSKYEPSLLVAIERCGRTRDRSYLNFRGDDISEYNAKTDSLFDLHSRTVGIGDGGNEIGMGNVAEFIPEIPGLPKHPCMVRVRHLIIAGVSNWGAYGMIASLSQQTGRNLLPTIERERAVMERALALGAVDGVRGSGSGVDGFTLDENSEMLEDLHRVLAEDGDAHGR